MERSHDSTVGVTVKRSSDRGRPVVTSTVINDWRELARRHADGRAVSLLWSKATGRVKVTVADENLDVELDLDVSSAHALRAFHNPFVPLTPERSAAA